MFSLTEHKSWNGYIGQKRSDTASLAAILGSMHVADAVTKSGRNIAAEIRQGNEAIMNEIAFASSEITAELRNIGGDLRSMGATLEWGFRDLLAEHHQMNQTLKDLLKTAKSPSQTWAFEQFDMARDAYARGLDKEALEFINNAINGYQSQTGNRLDHRFHFLKGNILLGNNKHHDPEVVDVKAAKQSFEDAARYAVGSEKKKVRLFAAEAYCHAAFAAYCLDDTESVLAHCAKALEIDGGLTEALYLQAKASVRRGDEDTTFAATRKALDLDPAYILKFSSDKDFASSKVIDLAEADYVSDRRSKTDTALQFYKELKAHANVEGPEPAELSVKDGEGVVETTMRIRNIGAACDHILSALHDRLSGEHDAESKKANVKQYRAEQAMKKQMSPALFAVIGAALAIFTTSAPSFTGYLFYIFIFTVGGAMLAKFLNKAIIENNQKEINLVAENLNHTDQKLSEQMQKAVALKNKIDEILGVSGRNRADGANSAA
ncbi:tetratricopeptide (TPR) repeat protein [Ochrobactrum daejeonense]|uniref:Tetratricopeptide (TPR) repeat protein n=1 Tax=Brucella daejeonensis TaxID=659015 RepID=A0A7W9B0N1_9HYPH|nr:hypothetical protein [Brucella daejeonensis]MBB5704063.1 tetratricopeptide (TPR) repeat protein [Brucella daejeonensis]